MGQETNIELIKALEKQIEGGQGDVIELKRARNSLLNISIRVPPEILGTIFVWIVTREQDDSLFSTAHFARLEKGSHNFLLVCRRWFEVASSTPEVWAFWGRTLEDWSRRCHRVRGAPVDLVLDTSESSSEMFDSSLRDALRDLAARDRIRQIHFAGDEAYLLDAIASPLIPQGEDPQERHTIESIIFQLSVIPVDFSRFFLHSRLPNLRCLLIHGFLLQAPFWDQLTLLQTTRLSILSLQIKHAPLSITTSQLFSILISNPNLRGLRLAYAALPDDSSESSVRVSLRALRTIALEGEFARVFELLNRLDLPALDHTVLRLAALTTENLIKTLGPHMQGHFQRDLRFKGRLAAVVSYRNFFDGFSDSVHGCIDLAPLANGVSPSASFSTTLIGPLSPQPATLGQTLDLLRFIPHEHVASLEVVGPLRVPEDLLVAMPNIETLRLGTLPIRFLLPNREGPHANTDILPSLRSLHIENVTTILGANWEPLKTYLVHRTSEGRAISLHVPDWSPMPPEVVEEIRSLVETFVYDPTSYTEYGDADWEEDEGHEGSYSDDR